MKISEKHMSFWGIGPFYVAVIAMITVCGWIIGGAKIMDFARIASLNIPMRVLGILLILLGVVLWYFGAIVSQLDRNILENKLVTKGAYAWVRNPIYSAFAIALTGVLLFRNNLLLLFIPFLFWILQTIMVQTEESELEKVFGNEYLEYKGKVNRCIPCPPQRSVNKVKYQQRSIKTFNRRSENYDSTLEGRMAGWLKSFLLENIQLKDGDQVLDIACGTGLLLKLLSEKAHIICYGIDLSEGMIQAAKRNNPQMEFRNADCSKIPYASGFFHILTNNAAYHHFTDTEAFAKEAFRILKEDGCLYITEINLPFILRKLCNILFSILPTGDIKVYTTQEIIDNFSKAGFYTSQIRYRGPMQLICFTKIR